MKKAKLFIPLLLLCSMFSNIFFAACNESNSNQKLPNNPDNSSNQDLPNNQEHPSNQNVPTSIVLSETNIKLSPGESHQLYATVSPVLDTAQVTWSSLNTDIATVDNAGTVTAVASGTSVIRAVTENNLVASCTVTVEVAVGNLEVTVTAQKGLYGAIVADINTKIILIPESLESFPKSFDLYEDASSYGIISGQTDTNGKKIFNNVPVGKYRVVLQSGKLDDSLTNQLELMGTDAPTQKGEQKIKGIFGDNLYLKLQALKKEPHNDTISQYTYLSWNISYGLTYGRSVEIKKDLTESLKVDFFAV